MLVFYQLQCQDYLKLLKLEKHVLAIRKKAGFSKPTNFTLRARDSLLNTQ